jgi:hypothetical protein
VNLSRVFAPDDGRDALRALAGILLGLGFFMTFIRKSSIGEPWGDWGLLITLLIITVFLYAVGLIGRLNTPTLRGWQAIYLIFGIILLPLLLFQFVEAIGGDTGSTLNMFWIFLVTAAAAAFAALVADVRFGLLLASISIIVSWLALWDKILSDGLVSHYGIFRGLLVIIGLVLVGVALLVYRSDPLARLRADRTAASEPTRWSRAHDVITGAAIAGVLAGAITVTAVFAEADTLFAPPAASPSLLWDLELLVASLLAVLWGVRFGVRGPTYVGGIGLFIFLITVGSELGVGFPEATLVGWPLILALIGLGLFVASLLPDVNTPDAEQRIRGAVGGAGPGTAGTAPAAPPPPVSPPPPPPGSGTGPGPGGTRT